MSKHISVVEFQKVVNSHGIINIYGKLNDVLGCVHFATSNHGEYACILKQLTFLCDENILIHIFSVFSIREMHSMLIPSLISVMHNYISEFLTPIQVKDCTHLSSFAHLLNRFFSLSLQSLFKTSKKISQQSRIQINGICRKNHFLQVSCS